MNANRSAMGRRFVTGWVGVVLAGWLALGLAVFTSSAAGVEAAGGQQTNVIAGSRIHVFTDVGEHTFSVSEGGMIEVLVVGGGGGGGQTIGGGGGGGGVVYSSAFTVVVGDYSVTVGDGGAGATWGSGSTYPAGLRGEDSVFGSLTSLGGAGGAGYNQNASGTGGSGGGNGAGNGLGGGHTAGQGNPGGATANNTHRGAGGGGAGTAGANATAAVGEIGLGGEGLAFDVAGTLTYYAGGGGGGLRSSAYGTSVAGGAGGGGEGSNTSGEAGVTNTGGGGGAAGWQGNTFHPAGKGGSGIVIVRYAFPAAPLGVSVVAPDPIGVTNATLRGQLSGGYGDAEPPAVYFCWGSEDGGTASTGDWERVTFVGDDLNPGDLFAAVISGLESGSNYTYRAYVTNTTGEAWSSSAQAFQTVYLPAVTNLGSVDGRALTWLRGEVTDTGAQTPQTWFEWWADGSAETNRIDMGLQAGVFSNALSRLEPNVSYYYRVVASNAAGLTASHGAPFATLADGWYVATDGSDGAAGTSWAHAFATVSTALAHAADWDVILVSNGVYELTAALTINAGVTLRGVNGATVTTLRRSGSATHRILTMTHADALVEGFTIANGRAGGNPELGSGIHMTGGTVRSCIITNNLSSARQARGGGVYMNGGVLEDCEIVDNQANGQDGLGLGSGIFASGGALIQRCRIYGNQVNGSYTPARGAVYLDSVGVNILRNSLVYGNAAGGSWRPNPTEDKTAGVYSAGTANRVESCTIVGNVSQYGIGVGLYMFRGHAVNTIVYFNHSEFRGDYRILQDNAYATPDRADTSISYSCAYPLVAGAGNSAADPLFADWQNGDFRLLPGSSALDTANPIVGMTTDFYGVERDRDGNGNGTGAPDRGAIEAEAANAGPLRCALVAAVNEAVGPAEFTYTAHVAGSNTTGLTYAWDFKNDDVVNASSTTAAYTFGVGWHDVKLTVSNAANDSVTLVREHDARIAPALIYVAEDGDHIFPFASPDDAATNIQSAVNAALATETAVSEVLVNDGHYRLNRQVIVDKGILLRSETGAEYTILDAQAGTPRRVMELYQADAVVEGFTLTGGRVSTLYYGAGINMFAGTVQHCVITNNIAFGRNASEGGGVRMFGGVLRGCTISDNRSLGSDGGGAGGGVWASGGSAMIDRCRIVGNRATASTSIAQGGGVYLTGNATLRNSIVAANYVNNNASTHRGAGVYVNHADSRVENCTIVDNTIDAGDSAGMYQNNGTVVNTILWRNYMVGLEDSLPDHKNYVFINGSMTSCNSYPLPGGTGNIGSDPMFIDRAAGDYRLSIGSPAIDAGINQPWMLDTVDLAGVPRILKRTVDMGCYETLPPFGTMLIFR